MYPMRYPEEPVGYYAHGVDDATAILPDGWRNRLIEVSGVNTREARGWCLEVHDLAIAKYAAGREKDLVSTKALAKHGMTRRDVLELRLGGHEGKRRQAPFGGRGDRG